jgi:hypothetical protein
MKYCVNRKEALCLVKCLARYRGVIYGCKKIVVYSDSQMLVRIATAKNLSDQWCRWSQIINDYGIELRHIGGARNLAADYLSRSLKFVDTEKPKISCTTCIPCRKCPEIQDTQQPSCIDGRCSKKQVAESAIKGAIRTPSRAADNARVAAVAPDRACDVTRADQVQAGVERTAEEQTTSGGRRPLQTSGNADQDTDGLASSKAAESATTHEGDEHHAQKATCLPEERGLTQQ